MCKLKVKNRLQEIYTEKGYDISTDNRSYFTKSINKALNNKNVNLRLCDKGYVWTRKNNGFKYNLKILINGKGRLFKLSKFDPESICNAFAVVTQMPHVKDIIEVHQDAYKCDKCGGRGVIHAFMHICKGICFDCLGIGYKFHSGNW